MNLMSFCEGNWERVLRTWDGPQDQHRLNLLSLGLLTAPAGTSYPAGPSAQGWPTWALMSSELEHNQLPAMAQRQVSELVRASVSSPVKRGDVSPRLQAWSCVQGNDGVSEACAMGTRSMENTQ